MEDTLLERVPIREVPAPPPLQRGQKINGQSDPAFPDASDEPPLKVDIIQGNIIAGFNKDFQTILCLQITDASHFKPWLKALTPFISTAGEVLAFNRLFKSLRKRHGEPTGIKSTWVNIAFSFPALELLTQHAPPQSKASTFTDQSFKHGLAHQSAALGDPTDHHAEGHPDKWVVGGTHNPAHVLLIIASDDRCDMLSQVARIEKSIYSFKDNNGKTVPSGVRVSFKEEGANLPPPLVGHEQFGNLDGVSQPGIRGRISSDPHDVLTPRENPEKTKNGKRTQGKPGQELLWPGEFVFGYVGQDPAGGPDHNDIGTPTPNAIKAGPDWADDGSFLVFRRLRQDVFKFHQFLNHEANAAKIDPLLLSSKLIGRWESGAPTVRNPDVDNPQMGNDDCANNDFEFNSSNDPADPNTGPTDCQDNFQTFPKDDVQPGDQFASGRRCPFDAHTRKSYPRNDLTPASATDPDVSEVATQTHRIIRRGIPFGPVSPSTPNEPIPDKEDSHREDRGLHFVAYQTSIERQFEFITQQWVNNPNFSNEAAQHGQCNGQNPTGIDPIIGQNNKPGQNRQRDFFVRFTDSAHQDQCKKLTTTEDWVIPTGGGYFFSPSIDALEKHLT